MEELDKDNIQQPAGGQEIDLVELAARLWRERRRIMRWCMWGAFAGLVIAFSIPKEYTVEVKLAPEVQGNMGARGSLGALTSMLGTNMGSMNSTDAMSPELYPDIVQSVPFMTELFGVEVTDEEGGATMPPR